MQDLELTFQQYKVSRDNSPLVRSSMRNSSTWQQQQQQPGRHRRSSSQVNMSSPSRFWDLSPPEAAKAAPAAALASNFTVISTSAAAAADSARLSDKDGVKQPAAAAGMLVQYQDLQNKWDAYKELREASLSPVRGTSGKSIVAPLSPHKSLEHLAPAAAAAAAGITAAATGTGEAGHQGPSADVGHPPAAAAAHNHTDDYLALLAAAKLSINSNAAKEPGPQHQQQQQSSLRADGVNSSKDVHIGAAVTPGAAAARGGMKRSIARCIEEFQSSVSAGYGGKTGRSSQCQGPCISWHA